MGVHEKRILTLQYALGCIEVISSWKLDQLYKEPTQAEGGIRNDHVTLVPVWLMHFLRSSILGVQ